MVTESTTESTTESLLRKIRALRAKADDPSVTEAEASAYAAKVAELLQKHNLHESSLDTTDDQEAVTGDPYEGDYLSDPWRRTICNCVAHLYFCKGYGSWTGKKGKNNRSFIFVGKPHNTIVAKEMSNYLINTVVRLAKQYRDQTQDTPSDNDWLNFLRACGMRVAARVWKLYQEQTAAAAQRATNGNPSNLPALYADEHSLADKFLAEIKLRGSAGQRVRLTEGAIAGRRAGDTISLSTQIQGNNRSAGRLLS